MNRSPTMRNVYTFTDRDGDRLEAILTPGELFLGITGRDGQRATVALDPDALDQLRDALLELDY